MSVDFRAPPPPPDPNFNGKKIDLKEDLILGEGYPMTAHGSGPPAKRLREYAASSDSVRGLSLSNVFQRAWHE